MTPIPTILVSSSSNCSRNSSGSTERRLLVIGPGTKEFTLIFRGASSDAQQRAAAKIAALLAEYNETEDCPS
jgi:hypothetical protein